MALKFSTGLINAIQGAVGAGITAQDTIAAVAATSKITDSGNGLWAAGFRAGSIIEITGFTGDTANNEITRVTSIESDGSEMVVEATLVNDAAGEAVTIVEYGQSFDALFKYSIIDVYSGAMPSDADQLETGTKLLSLTASAGTFTKGASTNGFEFDAIAVGVLSMKTGQDYSDTGIATGTAGYYVHYDNRYVTGLSTSSVRMMGTVGTASAQMILSSTSIVLAATTTIDSYIITQPAS